MSGHSYEIRIRGHMGSTLHAAFPELNLVLKPAETVLFGRVPDQAALLGLLDRMQELGLEVVDVHRSQAADVDAPLHAADGHIPRDEESSRRD